MEEIVGPNTQNQWHYGRSCSCLTSIQTKLALFRSSVETRSHSTRIYCERNSLPAVHHVCSYDTTLSHHYQCFAARILRAFRCVNAKALCHCQLCSIVHTWMNIICFSDWYIKKVLHTNLPTHLSPTSFLFHCMPPPSPKELYLSL